MPVIPHRMLTFLKAPFKTLRWFCVHNKLSLSCHNQNRDEQFELVLNQMKADYEEMYHQLEHKPIC